MKMLGFMIALTLIYWIMASYAQTLISAVDPCPSAVELAASQASETVPGDLGEGEGQTVVRLRARWSGTGAYEMAEPAVCTG